MLLKIGSIGAAPPTAGMVLERRVRACHICHTCWLKATSMAVTILDESVDLTRVRVFAGWAIVGSATPRAGGSCSQPGPAGQLKHVRAAGLGPQYAARFSTLPPGWLGQLLFFLLRSPSLPFPCDSTPCGLREVQGSK